MQQAIQWQYIHRSSVITATSAIESLVSETPLSELNFMSIHLSGCSGVHPQDK